MSQFDPAPVGEDLWRRLGGALTRGGLDERVLKDAERILPSRHDALRMPLVHRALRRDPSPGAELARLFVYDDVLARARVEALLGGELTASLVEVGVLSADGEGLVSRVRVTPFRDVLVASDGLGAIDPVIPPGPTTLELSLAVPASVEGARVLDLGCGPGSMAALLVGAKASRVVATDLSERACTYARATAALSGRAYETRVSDGASEVRGERFDWIVCQPPFVPRPAALGQATTYLHGGVRGDELAWRLFRESAPLLAERGTSIFRLDLAGSTDEAAARIAAEVSTSSFVAFVCAGPNATELAMAYASAHRSSIDASIEADARAYADAFEAAGISRMSGAIVVAWEGAPRVRACRVVPSLARVDASRIAVARASLERAELADPILARVTASVPEGAVLVSETALATRKTRIVLQAPHAMPTELSEPVALLLDVIAQGASLEEAAEALGRAIERPFDEALDATLRFARDALRRGLLEVSPD